MEHIFLLQIHEAAKLRKLINWHIKESEAPERLRRMILDEHRTAKTTFARRMDHQTLLKIIGLSTSTPPF
jgi:hypothetical protein